jgi:hypothetical protein
MARPHVVVLYEDKDRQCFGQHKLVVACVADDKNRDYWDVSTVVQGRGMGGNTKALAACRDDFEDLSAGGRPVVVLLDNDKIRGPLGLPKRASAEDVRQRIRQQYQKSKLLTVVLLRENAESLVQATLDVGVEARADESTKALRKRGRAVPEARDAILDRLAFDPDRLRRIKLRETGAGASFDELVRVVVRLLK